jgi:alkylation response protein AidB-like acyl-CoA dehydrogenase
VHPLVTRAEHIAEHVLFPAALTVDRADRIPERHLAALAAAGLYGIVGPSSAGGAEAPVGVFTDVVEALASGCLATAFVWLQHHGLVLALAGSDNLDLRAAWLTDLCSGRKRAGLALGGVRSGTSPLVATSTDRGWRLDGQVPWVTGWQQTDALHVLAISPPGELIGLLLESTPSSSLRATARSLVAANASGTVELGFDGHIVPFEHTLSRTPYAPPPVHDGGGRSNGSLALGVVRRCCALLGPGELDAELAVRRARLDSAEPETLAQARADAVELALRATAALIVTRGSRSITEEEHPQRLAREALFLSVFGSRPAIRAALLERLLPQR